MSKDILLEQDDAADMTEGEQITLLHWGNAFVDTIHRDPKTGVVLTMVGRLNLAGNVKDTKKKVHWLSNLGDQATPVILREFDHLMTKPKMEEGDDMKDLVNPCSVVDTLAIGDPMLKTLQKGDKMQLERRGYFIVDVPAFPPGRDMVLIKIPDGKKTDVGSIKAKIDPSKLVSGVANKPEAGAKAPEKKATAEDKPKAKAKAKAPPAKAAERPVADITRLNIVVGKIQKVWPHPDADKLYCEEIDCGEGKVRTIASGLRAHLKEEEMLGQMVIVLANLKPKKMRGFESQGMVLCATSSNGKVELLKAPIGATVGERVIIDGVEMLAPDEKLNEKENKAPLPAVSPKMRTNAAFQATFDGAVWQTSAGPVTCAATADGQIS